MTYSNPHNHQHLPEQPPPREADLEGQEQTPTPAMDEGLQKTLAKEKLLRQFRETAQSIQAQEWFSNAEKFQEAVAEKNQEFQELLQNNPELAASPELRQVITSGFEEHDKKHIDDRKRRVLELISGIDPGDVEKPLDADAFRRQFETGELALIAQDYGRHLQGDLSEAWRQKHGQFVEKRREWQKGQAVEALKAADLAKHPDLTEAELLKELAKADPKLKEALADLAEDDELFQDQALKQVVSQKRLEAKALAQKPEEKPLDAEQLKELSRLIERVKLPAKQHLSNPDAWLDEAQKQNAALRDFLKDHPNAAKQAEVQAAASSQFEVHDRKHNDLMAEQAIKLMRRSRPPESDQRLGEKEFAAALKAQNDELGTTLRDYEKHLFARPDVQEALRARYAEYGKEYTDQRVKEARDVLKAQPLPKEASDPVGIWTELAKKNARLKTALADEQVKSALYADHEAGQILQRKQREADVDQAGKAALKTPEKPDETTDSKLKASLALFAEHNQQIFRSESEAMEAYLKTIVDPNLKGELGSQKEKVMRAMREHPDKILITDKKTLDALHRVDPALIDQNGFKEPAQKLIFANVVAALAGQKLPDKPIDRAWLRQVGGSELADRFFATAGERGDKLLASLAEQVMTAPPESMPEAASAEPAAPSEASVPPPENAQLETNQTSPEIKQFLYLHNRNTPEVEAMLVRLFETSKGWLFDPGETLSPATLWKHDKTLFNDLVATFDWPRESERAKYEELFGLLATKWEPYLKRQQAVAEETPAAAPEPPVEAAADQEDAEAELDLSLAGLMGAPEADQEDARQQGATEALSATPADAVTQDENTLPVAAETDLAMSPEAATPSEEEPVSGVEKEQLSEEQNEDDTRLTDQTAETASAVAALIEDAADEEGADTEGKDVLSTQQPPEDTAENPAPDEPIESSTEGADTPAEKSEETAQNEPESTQPEREAGPEVDEWAEGQAVELVWKEPNEAENRSGYEEAEESAWDEADRAAESVIPPLEAEDNAADTIPDSKTDSLADQKKQEQEEAALLVAALQTLAPDADPDTLDDEARQALIAEYLALDEPLSAAPPRHADALLRDTLNAYAERQQETEGSATPRIDTATRPRTATLDQARLEQTEAFDSTEGETAATDEPEDEEKGEAADRGEGVSTEEIAFAEIPRDAPADAEAPVDAKASVSMGVKPPAQGSPVAAQAGGTPEEVADPQQQIESAPETADTSMGEQGADLEMRSAEAEPVLPAETEPLAEAEAAAPDAMVAEIPQDKDVGDEAGGGDVPSATESAAADQPSEQAAIIDELDTAEPPVTPEVPEQPEVASDASEQPETDESSTEQPVVEQVASAVEDADQAAAEGGPDTEEPDQALADEPADTESKADDLVSAEPEQSEVEAADQPSEQAAQVDESEVIADEINANEEPTDQPEDTEAEADALAAADEDTADTAEAVKMSEDFTDEQPEGEAADQPSEQAAIIDELDTAEPPVTPEAPEQPEVASDASEQPETDESSTEQPVVEQVASAVEDADQAAAEGGPDTKEPDQALADEPADTESKADDLVSAEPELPPEDSKQSQAEDITIEQPVVEHAPSLASDELDSVNLQAPPEVSEKPEGDDAAADQQSEQAAQDEETEVVVVEEGSNNVMPDTGDSFTVMSEDSADIPPEADSDVSELPEADSSADMPQALVSEQPEFEDAAADQPSEQAVQADGSEVIADEDPVADQPSEQAAIADKMDSAEQDDDKSVTAESDTVISIDDTSEQVVNRSALPERSEGKGTSTGEVVERETEQDAPAPTEIFSPGPSPDDQAVESAGGSEQSADQREPAIGFDASESATSAAVNGNSAEPLPDTEPTVEIASDSPSVSEAEHRKPDRLVADDSEPLADSDRENEEAVPIEHPEDAEQDREDQTETVAVLDPLDTSVDSAPDTIDSKKGEAIVVNETDPTRTPENAENLLIIGETAQSDELIAFAPSANNVPEASDSADTPADLRGFSEPLADAKHGTTELANDNDQAKKAGKQAEPLSDNASQADPLRTEPQALKSGTEEISFSEGLTEAPTHLENKAEAPDQPHLSEFSAEADSLIADDPASALNRPDAAAKPEESKDIETKRNAASMDAADLPSPPDPEPDSTLEEVGFSDVAELLTVADETPPLPAITDAQGEFADQKADASPSPQENATDSVADIEALTADSLWRVIEEDQAEAAVSAEAEGPATDSDQSAPDTIAAQTEEPETGRRSWKLVDEPETDMEAAPAAADDDDKPLPTRSEVAGAEDANQPTDPEMEVPTGAEALLTTEEREAEDKARQEAAAENEEKASENSQEKKAEEESASETDADGSVIIEAVEAIMESLAEPENENIPTEFVFAPAGSRATSPPPVSQPKKNAEALEERLKREFDPLLIDSLREFFRLRQITGLDDYERAVRLIREIQSAQRQRLARGLGPFLGALPRDATMPMTTAATGTLKTALAKFVARAQAAFRNRLRLSVSCPTGLQSHEFSAAEDLSAALFTHLSSALRDDQPLRPTSTKAELAARARGPEIEISLTVSFADASPYRAILRLDQAGKLLSDQKVSS